MEELWNRSVILNILQPYLGSTMYVLDLERMEFVLGICHPWALQGGW